MTGLGSLASRLRARAGNAFEDRIADALALAARNGEAWITKRPTPVKILRVAPGGVVTGRLEGSPGVDYVGVLRGGRAVYLEAKSCAEGAFFLRAIRPGQWDEMRRVAAFGAARALVVGWTPDTAKGRALIVPRTTVVCVVPWQECEAARKADESSLSAETLAKYAVIAGRWTQALASVDPKEEK